MEGTIRTDPGHATRDVGEATAIEGSVRAVQSRSVSYIDRATHKVTQLDSEKPAIFRIISMTISFPRHVALLVSACHGGAVDVLIPFPMPATMRPTIICGTLYARIWSSAPMLMMVVPIKMLFLRPKMSPKKKAERAPRKQPMS